jgi:gamma-glutamylaminecyclotransferase
MTRVFVYGTLKRHGGNHRFLAGQEFLGEAQTVGGHVLYSLGDYPGMVRSTDSTQSVIGEVWNVTDACLAELDALEGIDEGLYARKPIKLSPPFHDQSTETYFYLRSVDGRAAIGPRWPA